MDKDELRGEHSIFLSNRKILTLTGVRDVLNFDEETVNIITSMGNVSLKGTGLKIGSFNTDTGDMQVEGKFIAIVYLNDRDRKEGFFKKLWR